MNIDLEQRPDGGDSIWKINAAYTDASKAQEVVGDLLRAGMPAAEVMVASPWPGTIPPGTGLVEPRHRPLRTALLTGFLCGAILSGVALLWAGPGQWALYGLIGLVLGAAISRPMHDALTATSPPHWHDRRIGDPLGAITVEVSTTEDQSADIARLVMSGHDPSLVQMEVEPGPRPPSTRVLWHHDEGLSPLEAVGVWARGRDAARARRDRHRGRHLETGKARG